MTDIDSTFTSGKNTIAMSKNAIHNFNLSIKNSADIKSSEHLTEAIIKELAKVSKEINQQKDIEQLWQEQKALNVVANSSSTSIGEGATNIIVGKSEKQQVLAGNTSSVSEGINTNNIVSTGEGTNGAPKLFGNTSSVGETTISNSSIGEGVADTTGSPIMSSAESANITSPTLGAENNASIMSQTYASVAAQQTLSVPQMLQAGSDEPSIEIIKEEIKKKLALAAFTNDTVAIDYWNNISKAFKEGYTAKDFDGKPEHILFTQMYAALKQANQVLMAQNFSWDIVRQKMIDSIDANILKGKISSDSSVRWKLIQKQLKDDTINVANLFERYNELFLLLKEVEGLEKFPSTITITTKTKIYPNLSADRLYAEIGKENVYVFLKEINNKELTGSGVNKGAVKIKNTDATKFIVGESLDFILDEVLVNDIKFEKKDINWIVYKDSKNKKIKDQEFIFINEGTSFSYNFDSPGKYKVEAYGKNPGSNSNKKEIVKLAAFVEVEIITQEITIVPPATIKTNFIRPFTEEQSFKVTLKNAEVKTLNPLKFYYQIAYTNADKVATISDELELNSTGIVKLAMPNIGEYSIRVVSKDQYTLNQKYSINTIKNFTNSIEIIENKAEKDIYLWSKTDQKVIFKAQTFKIEPATPQEKHNLKWLVYDKNDNIYVPDRLPLQLENNDEGKQYLVKGESFTFSIPKKEGEFTIEAYSNVKQGSKSTSIKKIFVKHPEVTEAYWTYNDGNKKKTSGFAGEINHIKASIPGYVNQPVRIKFYLNDSREVNYHNDTKTNGEGEINKILKFDANLQKHFGLKNGKTAKIRFELEGLQNGNVPYLFKENANAYKETSLNVTTSAKITDVYFKYDDSRVNLFTQVPYGAQVRGVIRTLNMVGKQVSLQVYKNEQDIKYTHKTIVNDEGVAAIDFTLDKKWHTINPLTGMMDMFYLRMEGVESKISLQNGLNAIVETKKTTGNDTVKLDENDLGLIWGAKVSKEFRQKVVQICKELWGEKMKLEMANQLMICMNVETKGEFTANVGYPEATGLIQFTGIAITEMNKVISHKKYTGPDYRDKLLTKEDLRDMTEVRQLDFVKLYFQMHKERYKRVINNAVDMYMVIFAPIGFGKKGDEVLYDISNTRKQYNRNKSADGEYWNENEYKVLTVKKDGKITKDEMTPRIKRSIHFGKMFTIDIDETRKLEVVLAEKILAEKRITFSSTHPYRSTNDKANADDNIKDASEGNKVYTSEYGHARGKQVDLSTGVLYVLHELSKKYKFNVQELAGASHSSAKSLHYKGMAIDINIVDGKHIDYINYDEDFYINFTKAALEMGASRVFHPYCSGTSSDRVATERKRSELKNGEKLVPISDHKDHIHIQF